MLMNLQFANCMARNDQNNEDVSCLMLSLAVTEWAISAVWSWLYLLFSLHYGLNSYSKISMKELFQQFQTKIRSDCLYTPKQPVTLLLPNDNRLASLLLRNTWRTNVTDVVYIHTLQRSWVMFKTPWALEKLNMMTQILRSMQRSLVWQSHYFLLLTVAATMHKTNTTTLSAIFLSMATCMVHLFFFWLPLEPTYELCIFANFRFQSKLHECNLHGGRRRLAQTTFLYATVRE